MHWLNLITFFKNYIDTPKLLQNNQQKINYNEYNKYINQVALCNKMILLLSFHLTDIGQTES